MNTTLSEAGVEAALLPCPLCGKQPQVRDFIATGSANYVQIECWHFGGDPDADECASSVTVNADTMALAVEAWNRRASVPDSEARYRQALIDIRNGFKADPMTWASTVAFFIDTVLYAESDPQELERVEAEVKTLLNSPPTAAGAGEAGPEPFTLSWWNRKDLMVSITETGEVMVNDREAFQALFDALPEVPHGGLKSFNVYPQPAPPHADEVREALSEADALKFADALSIQLWRWREIEIEPHLLLDPIKVALSRALSTSEAGR